MGNIRHNNNASALLASSITSGDTSLTVEAGKGALFPSPTGAQYAKVTIEDASGGFEIMHLTSRSGDVLQVTRGQEGTIPAAFASGSRVENRITAGALNEFLQRVADTFSGLYDCVGGVFTGGRWTGGEIVNTPLRGDPGVTSNQLVVPPGGGAPTIGASAILHAGSSIPAAQLTGSAPNGVIPASAVTQHQAALAILDSQVSGAILARLNVAQSFTAGQAVSKVALAYAATLTPDCALGNSFRTVLTGPATLAAPLNPRSGMVITFILRQDATGSRVLTWNSIYKHPGGVDPALSTAPNAVDTFSFIYDDDSTAWLAAGLGLA